MVFQPHRYSRTRDLYDNFARVLSSVDALLLMDVYPAGKKPIAGADSKALCGSIRQRGNLDPIYISRDDSIEEPLKNYYSLVICYCCKVRAISARWRKIWHNNYLYGLPRYQYECNGTG